MDRGKPGTRTSLSALDPETWSKITGITGDYEAQDSTISIGVAYEGVFWEKLWPLDDGLMTVSLLSGVMLDQYFFLPTGSTSGPVGGSENSRLSLGAPSPYT